MKVPLKQDYHQKYIYIFHSEHTTSNHWCLAQWKERNTKQVFHAIHGQPLSVWWNIIWKMNSKCTTGKSLMSTWPNVAVKTRHDNIMKGAVANWLQFAMWLIRIDLLRGYQIDKEDKDLFIFSRTYSRTDLTGNGKLCPRHSFEKTWEHKNTLET